MAQPGHLPTSANNALPGASAPVPAVPVLTKQQAEQQAEHQAVIMHMVAEHRRRQEEDLMQMVFRLNAAVQHQGMREGPAKQPCGYTPVQVSAAFLDTRNLPCNFLPPIQEPEGWNVLRNMLINLINEDRVSAVGVATGAG